MATPTITALPPAPSSGSPATFNDLANALVGALPGLVLDVNNFGTWLNTNSTIISGHIDDTVIGATTPRNGSFKIIDSAMALQTSFSATMANTHVSFNGGFLDLRATRAASSAYDFLRAYSGAGADLEFRMAGHGTATCDGAWTGGGADYAEYFEWADGNPKAEDRRGFSVVLDGDKIRKAKTGEDPFGVISGNPSVVGDAAPFRWKGKYLRDDFGTAIMEDYDVVSWTGSDGAEQSHAADAVPKGVKVPKDAARVTQQRRKLNPDWNEAHDYTPREARPEWDTVGLMGKLRLRKGQVTGARWIRMRDVSADVEEWLVR